MGEPVRERKAGLRVTRGPNWSHGSQDGGPGGVGTTIEDTSEGWIKVRWDFDSSTNSYHVRPGCYDLAHASGPKSESQSCSNASHSGHYRCAHGYCMTEHRFGQKKCTSSQTHAGVGCLICSESSHRWSCCGAVWGEAARGSMPPRVDALSEPLIEEVLQKASAKFELPEILVQCGVDHPYTNLMKLSFSHFRHPSSEQLISRLASLQHVLTGECLHFFEYLFHTLSDELALLQWLCKNREVLDTLLNRLDQFSVIDKISKQMGLVVTNQERSNIAVVDPISNNSVIASVLVNYTSLQRKRNYFNRCFLTEASTRITPDFIQNPVFKVFDSTAAAQKFFDTPDLTSSSCTLVSQLEMSTKLRHTTAIRKIIDQSMVENSPLAQYCAIQRQLMAKFAQSCLIELLRSWNRTTPFPLSHLTILGKKYETWMADFFRSLSPDIHEEVRTLMEQVIMQEMRQQFAPSAVNESKESKESDDCLSPSTLALRVALTSELIALTSADESERRSAFSLFLWLMDLALALLKRADPVANKIHLESLFAAPLASMILSVVLSSSPFASKFCALLVAMLKAIKSAHLSCPFFQTDLENVETTLSSISSSPEFQAGQFSPLFSSLTELAVLMKHDNWQVSPADTVKVFIQAKTPAEMIHLFDKMHSSIGYMSTSERAEKITKKSTQVIEILATGICAACTYQNNPAQFKCEMCGTALSHTELSAVVPKIAERGDILSCIFNTLTLSNMPPTSALEPAATLPQEHSAKLFEVLEDFLVNLIILTFFM